MLNQYLKRNLIVSLTLSMIPVFLTGCSSIPGAGFFNWRGEPSPESLASAGPEVTYPAPPSANSTPEAIASIAGGTSIPDLDIDEGEPMTQQFAGGGGTPDYATQTANLGAARANGYQTASSVSPTAAPASNGQMDTAMPKSYTFGDKAFTPKGANGGIATDAFGAPSTQTFAAQPSMPSSAVASTSMGHGFSPPSNQFSTSQSGMGALPKNGFSLPTDSPAVAAITPSASMNQGGSQTVPTNSMAEQVGSFSNTKPDFSTANATLDYATPSGSVLPPNGSSPPTVGEAYTPGSTSTGLSYPTDGASPTTNGSYFR
ncbi:hypothetical protein OAA27_02325 [bacterium]|nr:hypothetical protein [Rubripirellula sp.]MDB4331884.1 hypothetical protein [bacterium]MDB4339150.1 hypothetical protein [Rubripirellula sp.]MDB4810204.1 hypothetical protein [bacterium]